MEASPRSHREVAATVSELLPRGGRVLDFAAGPADKTAVLSRLGYECTAFDDLNDEWHRLDDNASKILQFAAEEGIEYHLAPNSIPDGPFDLVMAHDILEHLHNSPRPLLTELVRRLSDRGYLFVTVPNAVNIRKRLAVLRGRSNMPEFASYYWSNGDWRGHVREYVRDDLRTLAHNLGLEVVRLHGAHHLAHRLPLPARMAHLAVSRVFDGLRDTWVLVARKQPGAMPAEHPDPTLARRLELATSPYFSRK